MALKSKLALQELLFVVVLLLPCDFRFMVTSAKRIENESLNRLCRELKNETFNVVYDVYGVSLRFR